MKQPLLFVVTIQNKVSLILLSRNAIEECRFESYLGSIGREG